jgi:hypothetical protein
VLNSRGQIRIRPTFQLESYSNVYAIGDVTNWEEQKQAAKAPKHAQIAAANILAQLSGKEPKTTYSGQPELIIITNGKVSCCSFCFTSSSLSDILTSAEARHFFRGYALGHYTGQLVLEFNEGQGAYGEHDAEGLRSLQVKCPNGIGRLGPSDRIPLMIYVS